MSKYRIRSNGTKIYIQKQYTLFEFNIPLWLAKRGRFDSSIIYYTTIQNAEEQIKKYCEDDMYNANWNEPCENIKEITCNDVKKLCRI